MSQSTNQYEPWRTKERHYCALCNSWMSSDRASILTHENGKKHRENVEQDVMERKESKQKMERSKNRLEGFLEQMEKDAAVAMAGDVAYCGVAKGRVRDDLLGQPQQQQQERSLGMGVGVGGNGVQPNVTKPKTDAKNGIASWENRKKSKRTTEQDGTQTTNTEDRRKKRKLGPKEGHYTIGETTYLEGPTFAPLFEEDMTVQIWTGSSSMTADYKKSSNSFDLWKNGIIIRIHKRRPTTPNDQNDEEPESSFLQCDVSYLKNLTDDDETIEKRVSADRLRLILASDELTPSTIEEARLALLGGEEITVVNDTPNITIDEHTGLSTWTVSSVRKTTVNCERKQERVRLRAKKREEEEKEANKQKEAAGRKMEEAKHENADDSALGAYDVWSTSGKGGYKGVKINSNVRLDVSETAKSLSRGQTNIKFKKRGGNRKDKKSRRTSFADDD